LIIATNNNINNNSTHTMVLLIVIFSRNQRHKPAKGVGVASKPFLERGKLVA
jgi:hypothetical protein